MRFTNILPFAAFSAAFVVPNEQVFNELAIEDNTHFRASQEPAWSKDEVLDSLKKHFAEAETTVEHKVKAASSQVKNVLDDALVSAGYAGSQLSDKIYETAFDAQSWIESAANEAYDAFDDHEGPPHHGPPHHDPPHHGPPHDGHPHHPPHHDKPNMTVYQLISESKYTTKLAKLLNDYPDLVEALNGTKANYTVFAPTDKAFEKIPDHPDHKPSKEQLKKVLEYHLSPDFYPAGRVLVTHTIPTLLKGERLPGKDTPQRLSVNLGLKGLTLNFYSRVVAIDIFGTNGVIHGIDSILLPPPKVIKIIDLLPSEFSTLELGLVKTGLYDAFNSTDHPSGTFFAPSNFAFAKLGPRINAFLFSSHGLKYLKALLMYHAVPHRTLYSDAYYEAEAKAADEGTPKGYYHYDLPTGLEDRHLSVDVARYGGFISIKVNGFSRVTIQDGIAEDGVIQVVSDVLIPPKQMSGLRSRLSKWNFWSGEEEMSVEEFKQRFEPFVGSKLDL